MASNARLAKKNLAHANLATADLAGADMAGADLRHATLKQTNLAGANLAGADLRRDNLQAASLREANLSGADLSEADLRDADLAGADLRRARLNQATLRRANLTEADLAEADLDGADLSGANPDAARSLAGTKMAGAAGLTPEQREACTGRSDAADATEAVGGPLSAAQAVPLGASVTTWRLRAGADAEGVARAAASHLASLRSPGLAGAFALRTSSDALEVVLVAEQGMGLERLAERLAEQAEQVERRNGDAWNLLALVDGDRPSLG